MQSWPDSNRESRLVFILKNIDSSDILKSLEIFNKLGGINTE